MDNNFKYHSMRLSILLYFILLVKISDAQTFTYTYDPVGNRTGREYCGGCRLANPATPKDSLGKDVAVKYGISVYPNPTSQNINIIVKALIQGQEATIYLFDAQGKSILTRNQSKGEEMIDLRGLNSGIYQLSVFVNDERVSYRIVKL